MKWYGLNVFLKKINYSKKIKSQVFLQNKKKLNVNIPKINVKPFLINLYLPFNWNFTFLQKKINKLHLNKEFLIFLYSSFYYFILPVNSTFIKINYNKQISILSFLYFYNNNFNKIFWSFFKIIFYSFSKIFFKKIKFKGKGYYIYKNLRNTIALQFNYSHIKRLYFFFFHVKFLSKTSIILFGTSFKKINFLTKKLFLVRPMNIFTGKGMRFTRQIIYRKTGKISSYR